MATCAGFFVDTKQVFAFDSPAGLAELWKEKTGSALVSVSAAKTSQCSSC